MTNDEFARYITELRLKKFGQENIDPSVKEEMIDGTKDELAGIRSRCSSDEEAQAEYKRTRGIS